MLAQLGQVARIKQHIDKSGLGSHDHFFRKGYLHNYIESSGYADVTARAILGNTNNYDADGFSQTRAEQNILNAASIKELHELLRQVRRLESVIEKAVQVKGKNSDDRLI